MHAVVLKRVEVNETERGCVLKEGYGRIKGYSLKLCRRERKVGSHLFSVQNNI